MACPCCPAQLSLVFTGAGASSARRVRWTVCVNVSDLAHYLGSALSPNAPPLGAITATFDGRLLSCTKCCGNSESNVEADCPERSRFSRIMRRCTRLLLHDPLNRVCDPPCPSGTYRDPATQACRRCSDCPGSQLPKLGSCGGVGSTSDFTCSSAGGCGAQSQWVPLQAFERSWSARAQLFR